MIIDTHAHYDDEQFDTDREELLDSMEAGGIGLIVNAGSTVESWDKIVRLTERYPFLYGAIGVHPDEAGSLDEEKFSRMSICWTLIRSLLWEKSDWIITGIKRSMIFKKNGLSASLTWRGKRICLLLSTAGRRRADTFEIMKKHAAGMKAVIHCYSYSPEMAREYVKMGILHRRWRSSDLQKRKEIKNRLYRRSRWNLSCWRRTVHILLLSHTEERGTAHCICLMWRNKLQS